MKLVLLIFITGCITITYSFSRDEERQMEKIGFFQFFILESIILMAGDECSVKVNRSIRKAKLDAINCIGDIHVTDTFCESLTDDWLKCLKPLGKKLEECNKNSILKDAIEKAIGTAIYQADFICKNEVADLLELGNPCFLKSLEEKEPCVNRFMIDVQSVFMTQKKLTDELCRASTVLENCLTSTIEKNCARNTSSNMFHGIYSASVKNCNSSI